MPAGVSCLCLTYGRPFLLEEAVESFLRQTWTGPRELVILNDHPDQELLFDHRDVLVVNKDCRLPSLGAKRNLAVALARYEYLLPWDDDDIHLPWRIEETMRELEGRHFFKCPQVWQTDQGRLEDQVQDDDFAYHATAAYTRSLFEQLGGYQGINGGEDQAFEGDLRQGRTTSEHWHIVRLPLDRLFYIYRRWHGSYHASGVDDLRDIEPEIDQGRYRVRPHWNSDYCKDVSRLIERIRAA